MLVIRVCLFLLLYCSSAAVFAAELHLQSGPQQTVMIELYTSEGCNSCPPAEQFLNRFVTDKQLWTTYIPLAFHVDYWDYLGWHDPFAQAANSQRQQYYGKVRQARTIYTPEFFVNGREWRRGLFGHLPSVSTQSVGILKVLLRDTRLSAEFDSSRMETRTLQMEVAVLGMDLTSDIRAGENAGRRATHQFTVLGHKQVTSHTAQWQTTLPAIGDHVASRRALVVWVSAIGDPAPLQAAGGFIPQ
jgi:hypothetical protein